MPAKRSSILVIGAAGQIGTDLVSALRKVYPSESVVACCHKTKPELKLSESGPVEFLDAADVNQIKTIVNQYNPNTIYNLATILSGAGETNPGLAWETNVISHKNILDVSVECAIDQVFWPSSIAVFGPTTPSTNTPQHTILEPTSMYGVTKVTGENLSNYYHQKYGLDVRSIRFPGLISVSKFSGGGTSDYTVEMILSALKNRPYECFVNRETRMPLMAMEDAIEATLMLMQASRERITVRTSYNLGALSFSAGDLEKEIVKYVPDFRCTYVPDFRQAIADSWPDSVDDSIARSDWNWDERIDLPKLVSNLFGKK
jgi:nucleoside-diphosphate-sugar epimerase